MYELVIIGGGPGLIPSSELVKGLVNLSNIGEIETNRACETNIPGLFAAGEGAKAAVQAHKYLQRL